MMAESTNVELTERVSSDSKREMDGDELWDDEGGEIGEQGFVLPAPSRGKHQLRAMLRRQWLYKVCTSFYFGYQSIYLSISSSLSIF